MNTPFSAIFFCRPPVLVALTAVLFALGCGTPRAPAPDREVPALESIPAAAVRIEATRDQVPRATAALRELMDGVGEISTRYANVRSVIERLRADVAAIDRSVAGLRVRGDAYIADSARRAAEIVDPEARDAASARRSAVAAALRGIYPSHQAVREARAPFLAGLADLQTVLDADVSEGGLASIRPFVMRAEVDAGPLREALDALAVGFRAVDRALRADGY